MKGCLVRGLWVVVALLVVTVALFLLGVSIELAGSGMPRLRFAREAVHFDRLEQHRAEQAGTTADAAGLVGEGEWPSYRGTDGTGNYRGAIHTDWSTRQPPVLYRQPIGGGYASFVAGEGLVFTIEQRRDEEAVVAYEPASGIERWAVAWSERFSEAMGGDGPRATPAYADGRLFALGAAGELRALEAASGRTLWHSDTLQDTGATNLQWGIAGSPLVVEGLVVVQPGGANGSVVAYDALQGGIVWRALSDQTSYASPMVATIAGQRQLLVLTASRLVGLGLDGSGPLWEYPWRTFNDVNAAQPIVIGDNRVFVSSGYGLGAAVVEVTANADGFAVREVWRNEAMKNRFASSVLVDGHIYGLDEGIMACVDAATGEREWKGGRYGHGQMLFAGGKILVLTERGDLALVQPTPEGHQELAQMSVLEGKTWNNPAIVGGLLLVRNAAQMAAIDLRPTS
jgi:outer membrane protein assembly factor BamB